MAVNFSHSQNLTQTIKGIVIDKDNRRPLAGATVSIADDSIQQAVLSNENGRFMLKNIPVGRRRIQCTYSGYENYITDNILLNSAREVELIIELEQQYQQQAEVIVKAPRNPKQPVNRSSVVSTRSFTPEETNRYAASVNDPGRMALIFPGVQPTRDARSDIIIRGNSAAGPPSIPVNRYWMKQGLIPKEYLPISEQTQESPCAKTKQKQPGCFRWIYKTC